MARRSFVQIGGKLYERGVDVIPDDVGSTRSAAVLGDVPDFVSPIDGSVVSGRAGLREHCKKHDVVPTQELKGLPPKPMIMPTSQAYREETKRTMAEIMNSRNY